MNFLIRKFLRVLYSIFRLSIFLELNGFLSNWLRITMRKRTVTLNGNVICLTLNLSGFKKLNRIIKLINMFLIKISDLKNIINEYFIYLLYLNNLLFFIT